MIDQRVWQINERGRKEVNFLAAFLKFFGGGGLRGFVQQGVKMNGLNTMSRTKEQK